MTETVARVLVESALPQLDRLFDYRVPVELDAAARAGVRVRVPLRNAIANGYIVERVAAADFAGELAPLESVISPLPVLAPEIYRLARTVADRQAGSAADLLRLAVPTRQVRVEKSFVPGEPTPPPADVDLRGIDGYPEALIDGVRAGARIALEATPGLTRLRDGTWVGTWATVLATLAADTVARGRSAILAVPDYRDLGQLAAALAMVLPAELVSTVDAAQSNPDRYRAFLAARFRGPRVILGNRAALYAPAESLGLIALWDDGDSQFHEPRAPYIHGRDLALIRQELQGSALLLMAHSRSSATERLVEVGWLESVSPRRPVHPRIILTELQDTDGPSARIPSTAWHAARAAAQHGPILIQVARPGSAALAPIPAGQPHLPADAGRTAHELGRAFPGLRVVISDGEHPLVRLADAPVLVVATRGAEPIADGGYRAVLLLDGERMLSRESLGVAEDCLRWWSAAASLAAPGAPIFLVGVGGELGRAFATWRQSDYARHELHDRQELHFPPAVRAVTITGTVIEVDTALEALHGITTHRVIREAGEQPGTSLALITFDYRDGRMVATALREAVIRNATGRQQPGRRAAHTLRVRFDDSELLSR
ncbi:MAG: primosomal protein N' [Microbacteriaceae bacterium]